MTTRSSERRRPMGLPFTPVQKIGQKRMQCDRRVKKMNTAGIERSETFKVVSPFECMFLNKQCPTGVFYDTIYVEEDNPSQQV